MSIGRNDPCPCNSGRKYKQCCMEADARRRRTMQLVGAPDDGEGQTGLPGLSVERLRALRPDAAWEIDAVPMPMRIADSPVERTCAVMVVADGMILALELEPAPPSEPGDIAVLYLRAIATVVESIAKSTGVLAWPRTVVMRHTAVAQAFAKLDAPAVDVRVSHLLPSLDAFAADMRANVLGEPWSHLDGPLLVHGVQAIGISSLSTPETWRAWMLPEPVLESLLAAAARFYQARPWSHLTNEEALSITDPRMPEESWTVAVMGAGGEQFGLAMYSDPVDYSGLLLSGGDPHTGLRGLRGSMITLSFDPRTELSRAMQAEFRERRWKVAGPHAYPSVVVCNTPAGGLSGQHAEFVARTLDAVARFTESEATMLATHPVPDVPIEFHDAATGIRIRYSGDWLAQVPGQWRVPPELTPGLSSGPSAEPGARVPPDANFDMWMRQERARLDGFAAWLAAPHSRRKPLSPSRVARHVSDVTLFLDFLALEGVPLRAVHEAHLRIFLYDWFPSKVLTASLVVRSILLSLRRLFEWLDAEGQHCPWALPLLKDRAGVDARIRAMPDAWSIELDGTPWRDALYLDLVDRAMYPDMLGVDEEGEDHDGLSGEREYELFGELRHLLLEWREQIIASGTTATEAVQDECDARQRAWERARHPRFGKSPWAVIRAERRRLARTMPGSVARALT